MIQTLGDIFLLVGIIAVGIVSFLLAMFLYHLVFVVMDLRRLMKRVNLVTEEFEEMLLKPMQASSLVFDWLEKFLVEMTTGKKVSSPKKEKGKKKEKKGKKKKKK